MSAVKDDLQRREEEKQRIRSLEDGIHMITIEIYDLQKLVCELSNQVWENQQKITSLETQLANISSKNGCDEKRSSNNKGG